MRLFCWMGVSVCFLFYSCKKGDVLDDPQIAARTVMVYVAANNSLVTDAYDNINQMESAFEHIDGNLIVYARLTDADPALYEISHDDSPFINSRKVKEYPEHDSSDPKVMRMIFSDMQSLYPATSYGAILWSHATSWLPPGAGAISTRSFGDDNGSEMDVKDLNLALPDYLDFLIFDACSMASVEVLYEIKEKTRYVVASPAEVVSVGMPYDRLLQDLFDEDTETGLKEVARQFYEYYNSLEGVYQSATISLLDMVRLETLAQATKDVLTTYPLLYPDYRIEELQRLDFLSGSPTAGYDFLDFFQKNVEATALPRLEEALEQTVLYKAHTTNFNNIPINTFSGLSIYVPHSDTEHLHGYYRALKWYEASGYYILF